MTVAMSRWFLIDAIEKNVDCADLKPLYCPSPQDLSHFSLLIDEATLEVGRATKKLLRKDYACIYFDITERCLAV